MRDGSDPILEGAKLAPEEILTADPAKMGVATAMPPTSEVEGQAWILRLAHCPCCGSLQWVRYDPYRFQWYACGNCGCPWKMVPI